MNPLGHLWKRRSAGTRVRGGEGRCAPADLPCRWALRAGLKAQSLTRKIRIDCETTGKARATDPGVIGCRRPTLHILCGLELATGTQNGG